jgi:hypothetical protein
MDDDAILGDEVGALLSLLKWMKNEILFVEDKQ